MKPKQSSRRTRDDVEWEMRALYAGMANEELFFGAGGSSDGGAGDIRAASRLIGSMVCKAGMFKPLKIDWSHASGNPTESSELSDEDRALVKELCERFWSESKAMLEAAKPVSRALADLLKERIEMRSDEIVDELAAICAQPRPPAVASALAAHARTPEPAI